MSIKSLVAKWWEKYNPYELAKSQFIKSGNRDDKIISNRLSHYTAPCQYWIGGLPSVCSNFDGESFKCKLEVKEKPTGYGESGLCDGLGRRSWCSHYSGDPDANEKTCVLPSLEKSGTGKCERSDDGIMFYRAWKREEIKGFNNDSGSSAGMCDGLGMGRGEAGIGTENHEEMYKLRRKCNLYRPWIMGFGAIVPRPFHGGTTSWIDGVSYLPTTTDGIFDGSEADPSSPVRRQLPYVFQVYNMRAHFQKCAYWDNDWGAQFAYDEEFYNEVVVTSDGNPSSEIEPINWCLKWIDDREEAVKPYLEPTLDDADGVPRIIRNIWSERAGSVICNGAHPGCPCYTGKWVYCVDDNMRDGMRITADQILELRFWMNYWTSQEEYDRFFEEKPGPTQNGEADETTPDIYTFTHWHVFDTMDPNESVMYGVRHSMCMPAPLNNREFDPDVYVTKSVVHYPKVNEKIGTSGPAEVRFPTLVRELPHLSSVLPELDVIYPYYSDDPWDFEPCTDSYDPNSHSRVIATQIDDTPGIMVIGHTVREKVLYVINRSLSGGSPIDFYVDRFESAQMLRSKMDYDAYEEFNFKVVDWMLYLKENKPSSFISGISGKYGEFYFGPIELKYGLNKLLILVEWASNQFEFRTRNIICDFYGAAVVQSEFDYSFGDEVYDVTVPKYFSPPAKATGKVSCTGNGSYVSNIFSVYSYYLESTKGEPVTYYSYCIVEYSDNLEIVENWTQLGPSGYVWVDLDDINISYLFEWEIEEAYMTNKNEDYQHCGQYRSRIDLEAVFPKASGNPSQKRIHVGPSCVLLRTKNKKPMPFFNSDWDLNVKYKYRILEPFLGHEHTAKGDNAKIVWPMESYGVKLVKSPFEVVQNGDTFSLPVVGGLRSRGSMNIMAYVSSRKDGRIYVGSATKLLGSCGYVYCRSVDILYAYKAKAQGFRLEPSHGFQTWRGADSAGHDAADHYRMPPCGDHECGVPCYGPMWYPFLDCGNADEIYYNIYTGAGVCTMPVFPPGALKWTNVRFLGPDQYMAWTIVYSSGLESCHSGWLFYYSKADQVRFTGRAKIRTSVSVPEYRFYGWALPPFGNSNREYSERWLTQDFISFIDFSEQKPTVRAEYMPLVMDNLQLYCGLNSFDGKQKYYLDPFSFQPQLSYMEAAFLDEKLSNDDCIRLRWDEIFDIVAQSWCSYPPPVYLGGYIVRYKFKDNSFCWAWPEYWEHIERADDLERLKFLELTRPDYFVDHHKEEHRLICEEGEYYIHFYAPEIEDGELVRYPGISLGDGYIRFFNIIYENYNNDIVDWVDDCVDGLVGGSGGDEEGNIYEEAMGNSWFHDKNTIFSEEAGTEKIDDRRILLGVDGITGEPIYRWYNRGLIAELKKSRLIYLPIEETYSPYNYVSRFPDQENFYHYDSNIDWPVWVWGVIGETEILDGVPIQIVVKGKWGIINKSDRDKANEEDTNNEEDPVDPYSFSLPTIMYGEYTIDDAIHYDDYGRPVFPKMTKYVPGKAAIKGKHTSLEEFEIKVELDRTPKRMVKGVINFQVRLSSSLGQSLCITDVYATTGKYKDHSEPIKVWERKYLVTTSSKIGSFNPDGVDSEIYRYRDIDTRNRGQYFPRVTTNINGEFSSVNKVTGVAGSVVYNEDTPVATDLGNLIEVETTEQKKLYEDAWDKDGFSNITLNVILPPSIKRFLEINNLSFNLSGDMHINSGIIPWENNSLARRYVRPDGLQMPPGHKFQWGANWEKTRCTLFGPVQTVYTPVFVHIGHGPGATSIYHPFHAYAGWPRLEYMEGRLRQIGGAYWNYGFTDLLSKAQNPGSTDLWRPIYWDKDGMPIW